MHRLDPGLTQFQFDIEGEVRRIDANEHIGLFGDQRLDQLFAPGQEFTQPPQNLHQPHDRQALHGKVGHQAFGLHQRATDPDELDRRMLSLECAHQSGAQNIAGGFTRHQRNPQIGHDQRVMPRVDDWIESRNTATSGNCAEGSASSASACSTVSPWR
ncbi:hypothetical protein D3C71_1460230 [compost metagenome]